MAIHAEFEINVNRRHPVTLNVMRQKGVRPILQFVYDVIAGAAAHVILMIAGLGISMIVFGKTDEGLIHLFLCVIVPFACAGMFIAYRRVCYPLIVSLVSGATALLVPPIVVAAYWNLTQIAPAYVCSVVGLPFSVAGSYYVTHKPRGNRPVGDT